MLIKNLEKKTKIVLWVGAASIVASVLVAVASMLLAYRQIDRERDDIYVLNAGVPLRFDRTSEEVNREVEYKSHINLFHTMFFTLPPDDEFMKTNLNRAMYLIDKTGLMEYKNLQERGYYNQILASSSVLSIMTDSIVLDEKNRSFKYYGTQRIDRRSRVTRRTIESSGKYYDVPRTENNPHGVLIADWRTLSNKNIDLD